MHDVRRGARDVRSRRIVARHRRARVVDAADARVGLRARVRGVRFGPARASAARRRRSTWTIDLAGIFTAAGARGVMLVTKTIGVDPRLAEDAFYEEDYLRDVARVKRRFVGDGARFARSSRATTRAGG